MLKATQLVGDRAGLELKFSNTKAALLPLCRCAAPGLTVSLLKRVGPVGQEGGRDGLAGWEAPRGVS